MTPELEATLKRLPDRPGVYLMKDARGTVIYVGKAQSLRSRVRSYWQNQTGGGESQLIRSVIDRIADVEYTMTDSVSEALLLEINLVKRYRPRYNVRLKDDKSYPFIKITLAEDFPRVERTRKLPADGSRYFGPYASASSVDEAMNLIRRIFPFRTCNLDIHEGRAAIERPCLLYHIKRCQAPCVGYIDKADYRAQIAQIEMFLEGRQETVARELTRQMQAASEATEYERAAALRDKLKAIERTMESQKMAAHAATEEDVLGLARQDTQAAVQLFAVRGGKMVGRDVFLLDAPRETGDATVLAGFVQQYYERATSVPPEVLVPLPPEDASELETFLAARRGAAVHLRADQGKTLAALEELAEALALPAVPLRIECYDISNFQGAQSVGSMVVFEEGRPRTGEYRRFRIKDVKGANDFASHQEVLRRRFKRARTGEEGKEEELRWLLPDLVVIDGGKGQLSAAKVVLDELGYHDLAVVGIAKEREEIFLPDRDDPVLLPTTSAALYLMQRLRDEAHRFAVTYHRSLRARAATRSAFDDLPGVGPKRRAALLRVFGSARRVREAPLEQVAAVPGIGPALAAKIKAGLEG